MIRLIICLIALFSVTGIYSADIPKENIGLAFIHGTNDHRLDAESEYWKQDFTDALADAIPDPTNKFVVHCDFSQFMWDDNAGGCVADQLSQFIKDKNITKLFVYTHSNGGNVIRWVLSHPTYNDKFLLVTKTVHQVVALAPSSGGTILADDAVEGSTFEEGLGWLLGYRNDAVRQQRISDMAIYNEETLFGTMGRPSLPVPFRAVIGTNVIASPFNSTSYCNGYFLNAGLKITQIYLDTCSDGFLDCSSQIKAGSIWFYDWQKTTGETPLSHNQSRHSCLGLEQILRNDIFVQGVSHES